MDTVLGLRHLGADAPESVLVLGMRVDPTSYRHACESVLRWAALEQSRYVCIATVHMVMPASTDVA